MWLSIRVLLGGHHAYAPLADTLRMQVPPNVQNADLVRLLAIAHDDSAQYSSVLVHLRQQIDSARDRILYPDQPAFDQSAGQVLDQAPELPLDPIAKIEALSGVAPTAPRSVAGARDSVPSVPLAAAYVAAAEKSLALGWQAIQADIGHVIIALATQFDAEYTASGGSDGFQDLLQVRSLEIVRTLRLRLLAQLYGVRATINEASAQPRAAKRTFQWPSDVIHRFSKNRRIYDRLAGLRVLRDALGIPGWKEGDDATEYSAWSRPFGTAREGEVGWSPFARTIGYELRYQQRKVELRQRWFEIRDAAPSLLNPLRVLSAAMLWLFKITAGFGFKPRRLAVTALGVITSFSIAYYADEFISSCQGGARGLADFPREIFYAINNLTNLGAAEPCGPMRGALASFESLIGIFMLSVLAAMLFAWLTDR